VIVALMLIGLASMSMVQMPGALSSILSLMRHSKV
jgi:hypothetical protein